MSFVPGEPIDVVREKVVSALSLHFANDRLTLEELESRLSLVYSAKSQSELNQLLADLPSPGGNESPPVAVVPADEAAPRRMILAVMGELRRRGAWNLPRELNVLAVMGNAKLDLRQATFAAGVTTINAVGLMSEISIIVPPDVGVEADGTSLMGTVDSVTSRGATSIAGHPTVRIRGFALMSTVHVKVRAVGEK